MRRRFAHLAQMRGALPDDGNVDDLPLDLCAAWGMAGTLEFLAWWLRQDEPVPVEKVAQYLERRTVRPAAQRNRGASADVKMNDRAC